MPFDTDTANSILGWAFGKNTLPNNSKVYIGMSSNDPEEAKSYGLFSEKTGGAPFYYAKLKTPVTCAKGEIALFDKDALQIQIAEHDTEIL